MLCLWLSVLNNELLCLKINYATQCIGVGGSIHKFRQDFSTWLSEDVKTKAFEILCNNELVCLFIFSVILVNVWPSRNRLGGRNGEFLNRPKHCFLNLFLMSASIASCYFPTCTEKFSSCHVEGGLGCFWKGPVVEPFLSTSVYLCLDLKPCCSTSRTAYCTAEISLVPECFLIYANNWHFKLAVKKLMWLNFALDIRFGLW